MIILIFIAVLFSFVSPVQAETLKEFMTVQKNIPQFIDYPADKGSGKVAKSVDLDSYKGARTYRTVLRDGFKEPADFAGHYVIVSHGCGSGCQRNWIIDKETGKIVTDFYSQLGVTYQIDSVLLVKDYDVVYSLNSDPLESLPYGYEISYYVMEKWALKLLRKIEPRAAAEEPLTP